MRKRCWKVTWASLQGNWDLREAPNLASLSPEVNVSSGCGTKIIISGFKKRKKKKEVTLDSNDFSFPTLICILWANKQELCRFTYFHPPIHTFNTQLLLLHRHRQSPLHSVTNTNTSMHLCWENQYNHSPCPHFSPNTQLPTYTSTVDTHIHTHARLRTDPGCQG